MSLGGINQKGEGGANVDAMMVTVMVWGCLSKAGKGPPFGQFEAAHFLALATSYLGAILLCGGFLNGGTPKWMVQNGKPY